MVQIYIFPVSVKITGRFQQRPDTESDLHFRRLLHRGWTRGGWRRGKLVRKSLPQSQSKKAVWPGLGAQHWEWRQEVALGINVGDRANRLTDRLGAECEEKRNHG